MTLTEFFKNLVLDEWYKALVYIGGLVLVLSLFLDVKGITNQQLQLIAAGAFLFGLGEWKNHKYQPSIKPANAYTGKALLFNVSIWRPDVIGIILDLAGLALIVIGIRSVILNLH